jgi:hypothetical protein
LARSQLKTAGLAGVFKADFRKSSVRGWCFVVKWGLHCVVNAVSLLVAFCRQNHANFSKVILAHPGFARVPIGVASFAQKHGRDPSPKDLPVS